jgi:chromosome segregation ATPase
MTKMQVSRQEWLDLHEENNTLKDTLSQIKVIVGNLETANRTANREKELARGEIENLKGNLDRKDRRTTRLKEALENYRKDTIKLVATVEMELERLRLCKPEDVGQEIEQVQNEFKRNSQRMVQIPDSLFNSPDKMSPMRGTKNYDLQAPEFESPLMRGNGLDLKTFQTGRTAGTSGNVWFNFERAQERFEELLESYRRVITEKDSFIKALEGYLTDGKRQRNTLQEDHFQDVRVRNQRMSDLEAEKERLSTELFNLKTGMNQQAIRR